VRAALAGRDALVLMPTGGGKVRRPGQEARAGGRPRAWGWASSMGGPFTALPRRHLTPPPAVPVLRAPRGRAAGGPGAGRVAADRCAHRGRAPARAA
jgi:hypothetical protein